MADANASPISWLNQLLDASPPEPEPLAALEPDALADVDEHWRPRLQALLDGPDPRGAVSRARLLPDALWEIPWPSGMDGLFHQGSYGTRLLGVLCTHANIACVRTELAALFDAPLRFPDRATLIAEMQASLERGESMPQVLGRIRTREYLRIIRGEYENAPLESICAAISSIAAASVEIALYATDRDLADKVVVFGMGKLGGDELNFLSDIDLIFFHRDDVIDTDDEGRAHRQRTALFDQLRRVLRALEGEGPFRPLFRVDLRLRPFGARGPLSLSIGAAEAYYERYGRDWERQAWLRAHPIAGHQATGELLLRRLQPFVYRRSISPEIFSEIAELMRRARNQAQSRTALAHPGFDVKLDRGGIREVEFFVQALQLLNGGKNAAVRSPSTLRGLDQLASQGLISDREHEILGGAYRFMRQVEHRIQLADGQQTHRLPDDPLARTLIVARIWDTNTHDQAAHDRFEEQLGRHRRSVMTITATLDPQRDAEVLQADPEESARRRAFEIASDPGARESLRKNAVAELGLRDPEEAAAMIQHLMTRHASAFAEPGPAQKGAHALLQACLESADPDAALQRLAEFATTRPAHFAVWRIFARPDQQELLRRVADLFGASDPLSRGLIGFPSHRGIADDGSLALLAEAKATSLPTLQEFVNDMDRLESKVDFERIESVGRELLRFKNGELVRMGLVDLGQRPGPLAVGRCLSKLADLILRCLLRKLARRPEDEGSSRFTLAVFALGKYGMEAMDYGSDLDLMFVFRPHDQDPRELQSAANRIVRQFTTLMQTRHHGGRLYEVDMRLRPSGRSGLLVSSEAAFEAYHEKELPVWERLALLRCRPIAEIVVGPADAQYEASALPGALCSRIMNEILPESCRRGPTDESTIFSEIARLKARIENELARESSTLWNLKCGRGSCMDFEFLVAGYQLVMSSHDPYRHEFFAWARTLERKQIPEDLGEHYLFQRQVLNRLRLSQGSGQLEDGDRLSTLSPRLPALARRMGLASRDDLVQRLALARKAIADHFQRVTSGQPQNR